MDNGLIFFFRERSLEVGFRNFLGIVFFFFNDLNEDLESSFIRRVFDIELEGK